MKPDQVHLPFDSIWFSHLTGDAGVRYTVAIGTKSYIEQTGPKRIVVSLGVSRCSIMDQFVKRVGRIKALGRATQAFSNYLRIRNGTLRKNAVKNHPFHTLIPYKKTHINLVVNNDIETLLPIRYVPIINNIIANQIARKTDNNWIVEDIFELLTKWSYYNDQ